MNRWHVFRNVTNELEHVAGSHFLLLYNIFKSFLFWAFPNEHSQPTCVHGGTSSSAGSDTSPHGSLSQRPLRMTWGLNPNTLRGKIKLQRESWRTFLFFLFLFEWEEAEDACVSAECAAELWGGVYLQCGCDVRLVRSCVETGGAAGRFLRLDYRRQDPSHSLCDSVFALHIAAAQILHSRQQRRTKLVMFWFWTLLHRCAPVPCSDLEAEGKAA